MEEAGLYIQYNYYTLCMQLCIHILIINMHMYKQGILVSQVHIETHWRFSISTVYTK